MSQTYNDENSNKVIVTLDNIEKIIFQYQGMQTTLNTEDVLCLLDFVQYLYCNRRILEKFFGEEKLNDTSIWWE